jgi:hypothetical protein
MSASSLLRSGVAGAARLGCGRARRSACAAAVQPARAAAASSAELVPTSVTLTKLKESGRLTKNVDGALLSRALRFFHAAHAQMKP